MNMLIILTTSMHINEKAGSAELSSSGNLTSEMLQTPKLFGPSTSCHAGELPHLKSTDRVKRQVHWKDDKRKKSLSGYVYTVCMKHKFPG